MRCSKAVFKTLAKTEKDETSGAHTVNVLTGDSGCVGTTRGGRKEELFGLKEGGEKSVLNWNCVDLVAEACCLYPRSGDQSALKRGSLA